MKSRVICSACSEDDGPARTYETAISRACNFNPRNGAAQLENL